MNTHRYQHFLCIFFAIQCGCIGWNSHFIITLRFWKIILRLSVNHQSAINNLYRISGYTYTTFNKVFSFVNRPCNNHIAIFIPHIFSGLLFCKMSQVHFISNFLVVGSLRTKLLLSVYNGIIDQCVIGRKIKHHRIIALHRACKPPCVRNMNGFTITFYIYKRHRMVHKRHCNRRIGNTWSISPLTYK